LVVNRAIESDGSFTRGFLPDEYVIEDLCSLLALLSRRLITPVGKIRERHPAGIDGLGSYGEDVPIPVMGHSKVASWKKRPATIITTVQEQNFIPNDPPPVGVDDDALSTLFRTFPTIEHSENIVNAARLYRTALELIESRPDIAYQLLVSTVGTLVGVRVGFTSRTKPKKSKPSRKCKRRPRSTAHRSTSESSCIARLQGNSLGGEKVHQVLGESCSFDIAS
jgi:hypothetical protein